MKEKEYITIGNPIITKDVFKQILRPLDNYSHKPIGGLWASEATSLIYGICPWYNYLLDARGIANCISQYKDLTKAAIFTLKENANILTIDTYKQIQELSVQYPSHHHILYYYDKITPSTTIFDFEEIAKIYDGVYINYDKLILDTRTIVFNSWSVNTLLLFNLDCIKEYKTAQITIDFEDIDPFPYIDTKNISSPKQIHNNSSYYIETSNYIKNLFNELIPTYLQEPIKDYDDYLTKIINCANEALKISTESKAKEITLIKENLKKEGLTIKDTIIIRNIVLNYLSNYLYQEKEKIINLNPSTLKKVKYYDI